MAKPSSYADLVTAKRIQIYTNTAAVSTLDSFNPTAEIPAVGSNDATADELISVTDIRYDHDRPETRTNIGAQRIYTHGAPDITLPLLCEGNNEMIQFFEERCRDDPTTLELKVYTWLFRVTSALGEQLDFRFRGKLTRCNVEKSRGEQAEYVRVTATIRVIDNRPAVSAVGAPMLESAFISEDRTTLTLRFSEPIDPTTVATGDIALSPSRTFSTESEDLTVEGRTITAKFASAIAAGMYTVTVTGVNDLQGNEISDTANTATFTARE